MVTCFLGLGSNLGDRRKNINEALFRLGKTKGIKIEKISDFYLTAPYGFKRQRDFLNAAARISTDFTPHKLLRKLKNIEISLGRRKTFRNGPRLIDLDILLFNGEKISRKDLIIPHPEMYKRDFVLKPLRDVAPEMFNVKIVKSIGEMRVFVKQARSEGKTIGFVPTMGYLHEGHLSLVRQAKKETDKVVVSIFVNPAQFGPKEDFSRYPRNFKKDKNMLSAIGTDVIFYPGIKQMYSKEYLTYVNVDKISSGLCGLSRPGHFRGVATIVAKLFNIISPDIAYFGQKDFQQARIIEKMAQDLNMPVKVRLMPTVRHEDGLAMSSRNSYLNNKERKQARVLYYSLMDAKALIEKGERNSSRIKQAIINKIKKVKPARIDYVDIVDSRSLVKVGRISGEVLIALAVWFGKTRLIDNILVTSN